MIRFTEVIKRHPSGVVALNRVNLHIARGEMAFLTGHSGAGKSTLLRLITVMERHSGGRIEVDGQDLSLLSRRHIPRLRRHIGFIYQDHRLLLDRTVFDNVALPLLIAGEPQREISRRVRAALDKVGLLQKERLAPVALSAGEQQRVGIARAVVNRPPLLLADEPTGNLDPDLSKEIMRLFLEFNRVGVTVLVASHDLALISRLGQRMLTLKQGCLVAEQGAR